MAKPNLPLDNSTGSAMMARLVVRLMRILVAHGVPEDEVEAAVEEIMALLGSTFGGPGVAGGGA